MSYTSLRAPSSLPPQLWGQLTNEIARFSSLCNWRHLLQWLYQVCFVVFLLISQYQVYIYVFYRISLWHLHLSYVYTDVLLLLQPCHLVLFEETMSPKGMCVRYIMLVICASKYIWENIRGTFNTWHELVMSFSSRHLTATTLTIISICSLKIHHNNI